MADRIWEAAGNWDEAKRQWEQRALEIAQALSSLLAVIGADTDPVDRERDAG